MARTKNKPTRRRSNRSQAHRPPQAEKVAFIAHVHELRKRLFYIAAAVGVFAGIAYSMENQLTAWLLGPAAGQQFIYTTPGGGFDFLFKLCLYGGVAASIPIIVYHIFRYINPLLKNESRRFMLGCTLWSSFLALAGIAFGYFVGLPAAMRFLLQNFSSDQISALITIQSYMSFVLVYLLGSALLFQLPLILILINRVKPLKPSMLMRQQRWVVLGAFIIGAIISPTPDIRNQALLSGPIILMYEMSIVIIWTLNRRKQPSRKVVALRQHDAELQAERRFKFAEAQKARQQALALQPDSNPNPAPVVGTSAAATSATSIERPKGYLQDFTRPAYGGRLARPSS
jgi:sec-independent protein translocase protein TatC